MESLPLIRRQACIQDVPAISDILVRCSEDLARLLGTGHWATPIPERVLLERLRRRSAYLIYATEAQEPVATFALGRRFPSFWPRDCWEEPDAEALGLFDVGVLPEWQRRGIGSQMLLDAEAITVRSSANYIRLDAYLQNPMSRAFYGKAGYVERTGVTVQGIDIVCLEKRVTPAPDTASEATP